MKLNHIYKSIACGVLLAMTATSCDLDYNPVDTYSDVTEGVNKTDEKPIFNSVQDVETSMVTLHKKFRDQQEHWYVDKLLIGDAHSDNAYAGTTGAEVVPYETNSIEGSNSVLKRDWDRFLGDIAVANRIIVGCDQLKALSESERGKYQSQAKIFRAMVMFDMVRLWGNFPVITTVGGDITEDNVEEMYPTYFPPQNTAEEAYAQIEKDLTEAVENEKRTDRNSWAELDENRLSDILTASQIKATDTYVTPPQIIWIDNSTIATLGNFSASTGKAKAKKTFNVSAIVAASLAGRQVLNYRAHLPEGKRRILYVDTEQSRFHCHNVLERILRLAGLPTTTDNENLDFICLREYTPAVRIEVIDYALRQNKGYGLVVFRRPFHHLVDNLHRFAGAVDVEHQVADAVNDDQPVPFVLSQSVVEIRPAYPLCAAPE